MRVIVLDLTRIAQATETDKAYHLDKWAQLFKANTWKELKAMVSQSTVFSEAVRTIAGLAGNEQIMEQYRAAEDFIANERSQQEKINSQQETINSQQETISNLEDALAQRESELAEKDSDLAEKDKELAEKDKELADALARIAELEGKASANP